MTNMFAHCIVCDTEHMITVPTFALELWANGELSVQDAFPNVSADNRELFFLSGICGPCFDDIWPAE